MIYQPLVKWQSSTIISCVILHFSRLLDRENRYRACAKNFITFRFRTCHISFGKKSVMAMLKDDFIFDENIIDAEIEALENRDFDHGETFCVCD